jgi:bifunctional enzyme CysN/CysC
VASTNITWHTGTVSRHQRAGATAGTGATLWLTGLSGSGKSTLADAIEERLVAEGRMAYRLDGDNLRSGLNSDLGFGRESRVENSRRVAEVARLFADAGVIAVVALISPYADSRQLARRLHADAGIPFLEIYLEASAARCASRDPKGLYAQASAGQLGSFTGVDDPYEIPDAPDLTIGPDTVIDDGVVAVLSALDAIADAGTSPAS